MNQPCQLTALKRVSLRLLHGVPVHGHGSDFGPGQFGASSSDKIEKSQESTPTSHSGSESWKMTAREFCQRTWSCGVEYYTSRTKLKRVAHTGLQITRSKSKRSSRPSSAYLVLFSKDLGQNHRGSVIHHRHEGCLNQSRAHLWHRRPGDYEYYEMPKLWHYKKAGFRLFQSISRSHGSQGPR